MLRAHNFFLSKLHFLKSKRTGKLLFTALDRYCPNYRYLVCKVGKTGGLEKWGQGMKMMLQFHEKFFLFLCKKKLHRGALLPGSTSEEDESKTKKPPTGNVQIKVGKRGGLEKCGQDMKN